MIVHPLPHSLSLIFTKYLQIALFLQTILIKVFINFFVSFFSFCMVAVMSIPVFLLLNELPQSAR